MKNNKIMVVLVIILTILVVALSGYIIYDKVLNNNTNNNNIQNEEHDTNNNIENAQTNKTYNLGDEVTISKLKGEENDYSKWNVLYEEGEYAILYSKEIFSKTYSIEYGIKGFTNVIKEYDISLGEKGEVRALNCNDLKLFDCDLNTLSCPNKPNWAGYSLTECSTQKNMYIILTGDDIPVEFDSELKTVDMSEGVEVYYRPVIKILKSSIK